MKANELRVGNLVKKDGQIFEADHITIIMAHNYEPISLTPEILQKAGFEEEKICFHNGFLILWKNTILNCVDFLLAINNNPANITHIKSVHQLQNLYFSLTGEELNIIL